MEANYELFQALTHLRKQSGKGSPGMSNTCADAFTRLDSAGCFEHIDKWNRRNGWTSRPMDALDHHPLATQVRHRKLVGGTRLGGAEFYAIIAETDEWVIYKAWDSFGRPVCENALALAEFNEKFERKE